MESMPFHYNYTDNVQVLLSQTHKGYCHITDHNLNERHWTYVKQKQLAVLYSDFLKKML